MASWAVLGVPVTCGPVTMMSAAASKGAKKEGPGLLDWLSGALDKETFSETDPILQKVGDSAPAPSPKKAPVAKKQSGGGDSGGGGLFGLFGKK
ncbi:hypothetical protein KP509_17G022500 [Ceratopteris richardii]|uniref:Uncharacterized protein n=1 Tax=Ceratopteris richardii TaxID=49495 RepID=A0A8T2SXK9_CERRI|nr:hypothetical protein KP509_17G022500 [Ceratopteris richardii]